MGLFVEYVKWGVSFGMGPDDEDEMVGKIQAIVDVKGLEDIGWELDNVMNYCEDVKIDGSYNYGFSINFHIWGGEGGAVQRMGEFEEHAKNAEKEIRKYFGI